MHGASGPSWASEGKGRNMFGYVSDKPATVRGVLEYERRGREKEIARREAAIAERDAESAEDREQITFRKLEIAAFDSALERIAEER